MARGGRLINIAAQIIKHKKFVVSIFTFITIICVILQFGVSVNYNIADYLPKDAPSTIAIEVMDEEFAENVPNTRVMIQDVTIQEALAYKEKLGMIDGVSNVTWLDDVLDLKTPIEMADQDVVESYYKDNNALISFTIRKGEEVAITDAIYELIGEENAMAGEALTIATQQKMAFQETLFATAILVPIIVIILILSTTSWAEPLFFLTAIGVSVLINLGTNIFLGEISFITSSVAPILQLAVSLDYAIFLLHSFSDYRKQGLIPEAAMEQAMKKSFTAIAASALTTFFGFIAISFMKFEIGADLGLNLVKGILLSFISVTIFLPALTLILYKWIDKTQHKPFVPQFKNVGRRVLKFKIPITLLVFVLIVPAYLGQSNTSFTYGIGEQPETTRVGADEKKIDEHFGKQIPIVLLVPNGDVTKEVELVEELERLDNVKSVVSYVSVVDETIPPEYLDESITNNFYSENYSRMILQTTTKNEGIEAFILIDQIHDITKKYFGTDYYLLGESVTLYDIKDTVLKDNSFVNLLTIITIAIVLLFTFKSISIPIILLLTIQASVWINLSIPYFTNEPIVYVGYLLISVIQLAATVDYAILLAVTYREKRREMGVVEAVKKTLDEKIFSIAISASILSTVGFVLWITSSNPIVSTIGLLLGRGALLAFIMVIIFLPCMLVIFDKWIKKTTFQANFYEGK